MYKKFPFECIIFFSFWCLKIFAPIKIKFEQILTHEPKLKNNWIFPIIAQHEITAPGLTNMMGGGV